MQINLSDGIFYFSAIQLLDISHMGLLKTWNVACVTEEFEFELCLNKIYGFPGGLAGKEPACRRPGFNPWIGKKGMATHSSILAWRTPWTV